MIRPQLYKQARAPLGRPSKEAALLHGSIASKIKPLQKSCVDRFLSQRSALVGWPSGAPYNPLGRHDGGGEGGGARANGPGSPEILLRSSPRSNLSGLPRCEHETPRRAVGASREQTRVIG